jgi:hypothetical protein
LLGQLVSVALVRPSFMRALWLYDTPSIQKKMFEEENRIFTPYRLTLQVMTSSGAQLWWNYWTMDSYLGQFDNLIPI